MASESEAYRKHIENLQVVGVGSFDFSEITHHFTQRSMELITKIPRSIPVLLIYKKYELM